MILALPIMLMEIFGQVLEEVMDELDKLILHIRDKERYEVKDM